MLLGQVIFRFRPTFFVLNMALMNKRKLIPLDIIIMQVTINIKSV